jgi:hypothetical protein
MYALPAGALVSIKLLVLEIQVCGNGPFVLVPRSIWYASTDPDEAVHASLTCLVETAIATRWVGAVTLRPANGARPKVAAMLPLL